MLDSNQKSPRPSTPQPKKSDSFPALELLQEHFDIPPCLEKPTSVHDEEQPAGQKAYSELLLRQENRFDFSVRLPFADQHIRIGLATRAEHLKRLIICKCSKNLHKSLLPRKMSDLCLYLLDETSGERTMLSDHQVVHQALCGDLVYKEADENFVRP